MNVMMSQITSVSIVCSSVCSGADQRKHLSSASLVLGGCPLMTVGFRSQRASNAEIVSIWWRHHAQIYPFLMRLWFMPHDSLIFAWGSPTLFVLIMSLFSQIGIDFWPLCWHNQPRMTWWRHGLETFPALLPTCVSVKKLLNKQSNFRWYGVPWHSYDVIV